MQAHRKDTVHAEPFESFRQSPLFLLPHGPGLLPLVLAEKLLSAGPLCSSGVTRLPRYYGPLRHPLAVGPFHGVAAYRDLPFSAHFCVGRGGLLQLLDASLSPCSRYHPAEVAVALASWLTVDSAFVLQVRTRPSDLNLFEANSAFTFVTAR